MPDMSLELAAIVLELSEVITLVDDWRPSPTIPPNEHGVRAFEGHGRGWRVVVLDFDIEPQGFPKGARGCDGAATHRDRQLVVHLTRAQATRAFQLALTRCGITEGVTLKNCDVVDQGSPLPDDSE